MNPLTVSAAAPSDARVTPLTVSALARRHGLSRTALLHYDRVGLLRPSGRSASGYRLYSPADEARLARISELRSGGLSLEQIARVLDDGASVVVLQARLEAIEAQLAALERERRVLQRLLKSTAKKPARTLDKKQWVAVLRRAGLDDAAMRRWHAVFEADAPEAHEVFLASLGLPRREIARIRRWAKSAH